MKESIIMYKFVQKALEKLYSAKTTDFSFTSSTMQI